MSTKDVPQKMPGFGVCDRRWALVKARWCGAAAVVGLAIGLVGCSAIEVTTASGAEAGIPFFVPEPYLLVTERLLETDSSRSSERTAVEESSAEGKTSSTQGAAEKVETTLKKDSSSDSTKATGKDTVLVREANVLWLPNPTKQYMLKVRGTWGTSDSTIDLKDGWMLTHLGVKTDSKVADTVKEIPGLLTAIAALRDARAGLQPGIYRMEFDSAGRVLQLTRLETK